MTQLDQNNQNNSFQDDTLDLKELFSILWGGRKIIILITAVFAVCSVFYALNQTDYYRSTSTMHIAGSSPGGGAQSSITGLMSIAGINLSTDVSKGALAVNTMRSRAFLQHLLSVENVLPSLMAAESYDKQSKKLVFDSDIFDAANNKWIQAEPSYLETFDVYMGILYVDYHEQKRMINLSVEHISPIFAQEFLDLVIRETDKLLRQKDLQRSTDALAFLTSELSKNSLIEIKTSINQLILSQLQTQMMAKISTNYVLNVIEPPFIPIKKFKPSRSLICILGTMFGFLLGILWIVMRHYFSINRTKQT